MFKEFKYKLLGFLFVISILGVSSYRGKDTPAKEENQAFSLTAFFEVEDEDEQIENSLLAVFRQEMKDEDCLWICQGLAFSDDRNRSSWLMFNSDSGLVRMLVLGNANDKKPIRELLNTYLLKQDKLPDLATMQQAIRQIKDNGTEILVKDTILFLPSDKADSVLTIKLDHV